MVFAWEPCGVHVVTMLCPHSNHMVSMLKPCGVHIDTISFACRHHMIPRCKLHGLHVDNMWFSCGHNVVFTWTPCGFYVDTTWFPCDWFSIISTSFQLLIEVEKLPIFETCNFLNNGPIFNPRKVLESSWSPLSACGVYKSNLTRFQHETRRVRVCGVCGVHKPIDTTNSLTHLVSCSNLVRFGL